MARTAIPSQRLVWNLRYVRSTHNDWYPSASKCVSNSIGLGDHSGHRPDSYQPDLLPSGILNQLLVAHRAGIPIHKEDFMSFGCEGLQKKHPKMRHKVASDPIIRVVEKNSHVRF